MVEFNDNLETEEIDGKDFLSDKQSIQLQSNTPNTVI